MDNEAKEFASGICFNIRKKNSNVYIKSNCYF